MSEIQFMEKPDWVSWDQVCECIREANTVNDKKGFHMLFSDITPDEMKEDLKNGKCIVALYNNKVIGTTSYKIRNLRKWYAWGKVIYHSYEGIRPEYRGTDVYFRLTELKDKYVRESGIKTYQCHTAEGNKTMIKINKMYGFKLVLFKPTGKGADYYSVTMVKWEEGCPFPDRFVNFMFNLSKFIIKTFFTTDFRFKYWFK
jgi:hypothetical protein